MINVHHNTPVDRKHYDTSELFIFCASTLKMYVNFKEK